MMPFSDLKDVQIAFDESHQLFLESIRGFVNERIRPLIRAVEESDSIPAEAIDAARSLGLMGVGIPEEYGGQGGDYRDLVIMSEEISKALPAFATMLLVNHLFVDPLMIFGTEEQKRKYLPPVAGGEAFAAHANTEPGAGSDVAGIRTVAEKAQGGWVINGRKAFISNADRARYFIVSARTSPPEPGARWKGITTFIVERDYRGVEIGQKFNVMGLMGERPSEVILNSVFVPDENVVGKVGEGFKVIVTTYDYSRMLIAAQAVGIAEGALEAAFEYSAQRKAFERPIGSFEGIAFKLAEDFSEVQAARLLTYWAATLADQKKEEFLLASSVAKYYATETALRVARNAISIHGGAGVDKETLVERFLRDAMITTIYEGANEIQRLTIARWLYRLSSKEVNVF